MQISNLSDLISYSSNKYENRPFIRKLDSKNFFSFFELEKLKNKMNDFLNSLKILKGDKILVLMDNSPILVILFLIIPGSFRIFVPLNPNAGLEEMKYIIKLTNPKILITNTIFSKRISKIKIKKIII